MNVDDWQDERDHWTDDGPDPWDAYEQSLQGAAVHPTEDHWSEWQQRGYDTPDGPGHFHQPPHSGLGIASVVLTVFAGLGIFAAFIAAAVMGEQNRHVNEGNLWMIVPVCGMILCVLVSAIGGLLGLIGMFQSDRQKLFPILGCLFAAIECGGVLGIIAIGLAFG